MVSPRIFLDSLHVLPNTLLPLYNINNELSDFDIFEIWNSSSPKSFIDDSNDVAKGSIVPVAMGLHGDENLLLAEVKIVDHSLAGESCKLRGHLDDIDFDSDESMTMSRGSTSFTIDISSAPFPWRNPPWGFAGDVQWVLECGHGRPIVNLGSSRLEMYGLTPVLPFFFNNQLSVKLLRSFILMYSKRRQSWEDYFDTGPLDYISWAIYAVMYGYRLSYDTTQGQSRFGMSSSGGTLNLKKWITPADRGEFSNCYDQAALTQVVLGLSPVGRTIWQLMYPFGYIKETFLMGIGRCNNPYFSQPDWGTGLVVTDDRVARSPFFNHVFLSVVSRGNKIADATIGPHIANESLAEYLEATIDLETRRYDSENRPGTANDVVQCDGVVGIVSDIPNLIPTTEETELYCYRDGQPMVMVVAQSSEQSGQSRRQRRGNNAVDPRIVNADLPILQKLMESKGEVMYYGHSVSKTHSQVEWVIDLQHAKIEIAVSIYGSADEAIKGMQSHLRRFERPAEGSLTPSLADFPGETNQLSTYSSTHGNSPQNTTMWVDGNIFTHITFASTLVNPDRNFIQPLKDHYAAHRQVSLSEQVLFLPDVERISAPQRVKKGQSFHVRVQVVNSNVSAVSCGRNNIIMLQKANLEKKEYRFVAVDQGKQELVFAFAHNVTGGVISKSVQVESVAEGH